jgi:SAM-dependent methyltransferase
MWDQRYSETGFAYGKSPNDFIREKARAFKPESSIVCLASGEGRNAVYLATLGHRVTAVDLSVVGLEKTRQLASEHGVDVETIQADLATFDPGVEIWDGATSVFAHVPPSVRGALHGRIVRALKPGGILLLEAYSPRHIEMPGRGGPPPRAQEMFMRTEDLKAELEGLDFETIQEVDREIQEGIYHEGLSAVVQVVARKPA